VDFTIIIVNDDSNRRVVLADPRDPTKEPVETSSSATPRLRAAGGEVERGKRKKTWGAIHQLLSIILKLRILVLLPVSTLPYVVIVKNYS
jgi:hypothetical protein